MGDINPSPECAQTRTQDILAKLEGDIGTSRAGEWVQSQINADARRKRRAAHVLTEFDHRALAMLCKAFRTGVHNLTVRWDRVDWRGRYGFALNMYCGGFATYDFDPLTRLVIGAHEECIRVCLTPKAPKYMEIAMSPRDRVADSMFARHPTIEEAIAVYRGTSASGALAKPGAAQ